MGISAQLKKCRPFPHMGSCDPTTVSITKVRKGMNDVDPG
jgi:hypothetical protein